MVHYLGIARVGEEDIGEVLCRNHDPGNDQSMDVVAVDRELTPLASCDLLDVSGHSVKVDEQTEEALVCARAVFEDARQVGVDADRRYRPGVETGEGGVDLMLSRCHDDHGGVWLGQTLLDLVVGSGDALQ